MKIPKYQPPHMLERTKTVKDIWIKQYEIERRGKVSTLIASIIAYLLGFWSGSIGHEVNYGHLVVVLIVSVIVWYGLRYLRTVYKINV